MNDVCVYSLKGNSRSRRLAGALLEGARRAEMKAIKRDASTWRGKPECEIAAFYGYERETPDIMRAYLAAGKRVVFADLGYWERRAGGRWEGYHKIAVDGRHPNKQQVAGRDQLSDRVKIMPARIHPWKVSGRHIIVAGMSDKAARSYGLQPEEWERWAIAELRQHTARRIVYRPKPSWMGAMPIEGADFERAAIPIQRSLVDCHAVVTHHSNVAIDGLLLGVPAFCWDGAAVPLSLQDLSRIETPKKPNGREQWAANLAYCQWNVGEIRSGAMWKHLRKEGLI